MIPQNTSLVQEIDEFIRQHESFDFQVFLYAGNELIICGSTDLLYYHQLEIHFHNVFFVSAYFGEWKTDLTKPVFQIPEPEKANQLNLKYQIEYGNELYLIKVDDYKNDVFIAAQSISYNTDTVLYYYREDLLPGQRLALGVTKPSL